MPIQCDPRQRQRFEQDLERFRQRVTRAVTRGLAVVGEKVVTHVRSLPSPSLADYPDPNKVPPHQPHYIDRTANLRSSTGYAIAVGGQIVGASSFSATGPQGDEGARAGEELAKRLAAGHKDGVALVVVAGQEYAEYVSALGYDVLDSGRLLAERLAAELMAKIKSKIDSYGAGGASGAGAGPNNGTTS